MNSISQLQEKIAAIRNILDNALADAEYKKYYNNLQELMIELKKMELLYEKLEALIAQTD